MHRLQINSLGAVQHFVLVQNTNGGVDMQPRIDAGHRHDFHVVIFLHIFFEVDQTMKIAADGSEI
jgi:hypothetical protein